MSPTPAEIARAAAEWQVSPVAAERELVRRELVRLAAWTASVTGYDRLGNVHRFTAKGATRTEALEAAIDLAPEIVVTSAISWPVGGAR